MELKTNHSLDMSINKEDLIDIMVDNKLLELEKELETLAEKQKKITIVMDKNRDDMKNKFKKKLLQYFPKEITSSEIPEITYHQGYDNTDIKFNFSKFTIVVYGACTKDKSAYKKQKDEENLKLGKELLELNLATNSITLEIQTITKSPRRLKAQLLKNFLKNSNEGEQVLNLINSKIGAKQLLAPSK